VRSPPGSSWLFLAPPGSSWLFLASLAPPASSWLLLAPSWLPPGSSWLLLAPPVFLELSGNIGHFSLGDPQPYLQAYLAQGLNSIFQLYYVTRSYIQSTHSFLIQLISNSARALGSLVGDQDQGSLAFPFGLAEILAPTRCRIGNQRKTAKNS
jgi:hypothetical protein